LFCFVFWHKSLGASDDSRARLSILLATVVALAAETPAASGLIDHALGCAATCLQKKAHVLCAIDILYQIT
jgi:hypothetical protein